MCDFGALTLQEEQFCKTIIGVGEQFLFRIKTFSTPNSTVILFLPTNPRGRFLIHKCIETIPELTSVSIGKSFQRRVVIFTITNRKLSKNSIKRRRGHTKSIHSPHFQRTMSSPRNVKKKPDQAIYVPRHRRNGSPIAEDKNKHNKPTDDSNQKKKVRKQKDLKNDKKFESSEQELLSSSNKEHNLNEKEPLKRKISNENTINTEHVKNTKLILDCAKCLAERLSQSIISDTYQNLRENAQHKKPKRKIPKVEVIVRQERVLPGIANNIVNLAIENAMQMITAIKIYDRKKEFNIDSAASLKSTQTEVASQNLPEVKPDTDNKPTTEVEQAPCNDKVEDLDDKVTKEIKSTQKPVMETKKEAEIEILESKKETHGSEITTIDKELDAKPSKKKKTSNMVKKDESVRPSKSKSKKGKKLKKQNNHEKENKDTDKSKKVVEIEPVVNGIDEKSLPGKKEIVNDQGAEEQEGDDTLDDWDANWTEDGECLSEDMKKELSMLTGIDKPNIENAEGIDYLNFTPTKNIELDQGEFGHIVEIFDFSPYLKNQDIFNAMNSAGIKDYNLTWVDDTHALAVFGSQSAAHSAIKQYVPVLQMRQVVNGSRASKSKARDLKEVLLPFKKRPESTGMVARNLVAGALGIRTNVSKEQRQKEKEILKEAREKRRKKKQDQKDVWENP
ncbi:enolase-phosphatase E1-like [Clytia hemisphaerica]